MRSNNKMIAYRPIKTGEESDVVCLVMKTFMEFVAPLFSEEGIEEFKRTANLDALKDRLQAGNHVIVAEQGQKIIGVIEIRENKHIALFFVEGSSQKKGIGRELFRRSVETCSRRNTDIQGITVNSSPNAVAAYRKLGFEKTEHEQEKNGIRFVPMEFLLNKKGHCH